MKGCSLSYADFPAVYSKQFHELRGIVLCSVSGAKARHCYCNNITVWPVYTSKRLDDNQKCQCTVKTTGNTYYCFGIADFAKSLSKTCCLYVKNLLTSCHPVASVCRHEGIRINLCREVAVLSYLTYICLSVFCLIGSIECTVESHPVIINLFNVNKSAGYSLRLLIHILYNLAAFCNDLVTVKYQIGT